MASSLKSQKTLLFIMKSQQTCVQIKPKQQISTGASLLIDKNTTDIGRIREAEPIKSRVIHPKLYSYLQTASKTRSSKELKPEDSLNFVPIRITFLSSQQKTSRAVGIVIQDFRAIKRKVIPSFPVIPNLNTVLSLMPPKATYFTPRFCFL